MSEPMVWHDEADRLTVWGTLDPPDACMCTECVLSGDPRASRARVKEREHGRAS